MKLIEILFAVGYKKKQQQNSVKNSNSKLMQLVVCIICFFLTGLVLVNFFFARLSIDCDRYKIKRKKLNKTCRLR